MAKKVQKGKKPAAKKAAPAKKANASKKSAKPAKKASKPAPKKVVKKAAPKKAAAKKPVAAKKKVIAKKAAPKKAVKPVKKVSKPVAKKAKPVAKKAVKPVAKKVVKPVAKKAVKPVAKKAPLKPIKKAPLKVVKPVAKKAAPARPVVKPVAKAPVKQAPAKAAKPASKEKSVIQKVVDKGKEIVKSITNALPGKHEESRSASSDRGTVVEKKSQSAEKSAAVSKPTTVTTDVTKKGENVDMRKGKEEGGAKASSAVAKPVAEKRDPNEKTRYSDSELQEFRELIMKKLDEANRDYELLKDTLSHRDNNGTDDTSPTFKLLEDGSDVLSKEETAQLAARQQKFIQALENALIRIENKTYGICRATGKLISKERLRSVPHATLSIEAKKEQS